MVGWYGLMEKLITNIIKKQYIKKINRYIIELGIKDEAKRIIWLTEKQMINLKNCFNETKNGYSDKNISIIGIWNDKGYFSYSKIEHHKQEKLFTLPKQYNLDDLIDNI
jgi:preprotein translocase subunit SecA